MTIIIAVYNAVRYLELVLTSLMCQSYKDFDVIIADDGSGEEMKLLIEKMSKEVDFPILHLWQEDIGFRKTTILNSAIKNAKSDYLVFIDGDCLLHHHFVKDHFEQREPNTVLSGRRVMLGEKISNKLTKEDVIYRRHEKLTLDKLVDIISQKTTHYEQGIRIENKFIRSILPHKKQGLLGSNFSVEKELLVKINGFNQDYNAPGFGEDTDIEYRLGLISVKFKSIKHLAIQYHLYHPITVVGSKNKEIFSDVVSKRNPVCSNGLKRL